METGAVGGRRPRPTEIKIRVTDEERSVMEAASRTPDLLRHLNVPLTVVGGSLRFIGKLGSIAVAALKLLLHVFSYVGTDPATRQLSMQEFLLPRFVAPTPLPVQTAWPTQTVSAISETVTWAKGLATHAIAAIEATKQVALDSEFLMLEHDECSQAELGFSVRPTTCLALHCCRPAPCPPPPTCALCTRRLERCVASSDILKL